MRYKDERKKIDRAAVRILDVNNRDSGLVAQWT